MVDRRVEERLEEAKRALKEKNCQPETEVIRAILEARIEQNITQKELARRTGIDQGDISKLEYGARNPSLKLLKRLAKGLNMKLKIEFVPMDEDEIEENMKSLENNSK